MIKKRIKQKWIIDKEYFTRNPNLRVKKELKDQLKALAEILDMTLLETANQALQEFISKYDL